MQTVVKVIAEQSVAALELLGILVICLVVLYAIGRTLYELVNKVAFDEIFRHFREAVIRGILVGLELLVASDIIRTVTVEFTLYGVATLAILVAIRTLLSFTLEVEMTGRWPWQGHQQQRE